MALRDVRFRALSAGGSHNCGIREDNRGAACWGNNGSGQSTPPALVIIPRVSIEETIGLSADGADENDYVLDNNLILEFPGSTPGTIQSIPIDVIDDNIFEGEESFVISLFDADTGERIISETIIITDKPRISIVSTPPAIETPGLVSEYAFAENVGTLSVAVSVLLGDAGELPSPAIIRLTTQNGTAMSPRDYVRVDRDLVFGPGVTTVVATIDILDDRFLEGDLIFAADISANNDNVELISSQARFVIQDNETLVSVRTTAPQSYTGAIGVTTDINLSERYEDPDNDDLRYEVNIGSVNSEGIFQYLTERSEVIAVTLAVGGILRGCSNRRLHHR